VDELVVDIGSTIPQSVNLIGVLRSGPDLRELISLLEREGISVVGVLTAGTSLSEIERMSAATLNIVLCESSGKEAAELLRQRFGTPYLIADLPIGARATDQFCSRVAGALGISYTTGCSDQSASPSLPQRRIAIIGGPTRTVAFTRFLQELGKEPVLIVLDFDTETQVKLREMTECEILFEPDQDLILRKLVEKQVDLIMGGMLERSFAAILGIQHFDMMHGSQKTVGEEGRRNLFRILQGQGQESSEHR
jgi:nitrogenase molybdenum-iron protein alpha/beta subunit